MVGSMRTWEKMHLITSLIMGRHPTIAREGSKQCSFRYLCCFDYLAFLLEGSHVTACALWENREACG